MTRLRITNQGAVTVLSCIALGSVLLPWFTDWVPFSLDDPRFILVPVSPLQTWAGWGVTAFDALLLMLAWSRVPEWGPRTQGWLAAAAILVLGIEGVRWVAMSRPDLEMRVRALGPPDSGWSWLRWEFAFPVMANMGLLILCWSSRCVGRTRRAR